MASTHKLFTVSVLLVLTMASTSITAAGSARSPLRSQAATLGARLKLDGESPNCWDSLFQLQACTGELIMFFLNGETYLGPSCCRAIRVVGHDCWPEMLPSLGFTPQEGDVLQGYCDAEQQQQQQEEHSPPSSPTIVDATKVLP